MTHKTRVVATVAAAVALTVAACGSDGSSGSQSSSSAGATGAAAAGAGGTLYYLTKRPAEHLDPQRTYIGRDLADMGRIVYRSLVQFPVTEDLKEAATPVPDLATDTGKSENGGKQWTFTLKDGVKWQDGKDVTCEDLKYGFSRSFATDVITGGPNYQLAYLDVPKKDGAAIYNGPYKKQGQADFDKAVTCTGKTITYRFSKPWPDFPLAIASLRVFDPYRADQDKGDQSNYAIFSTGPYKLQGTWTKGTGGTFVRNEQYDPKTDGVRKALPDKIVFQEGLTNEIISQRLIADGGNDRFAVTDRQVPPAFFAQVTGKVAERVANPESPFVNYLLPNFNRMTNPKVRQALAMSTNKAAYAAALGGEKVSKPAKSIVSSALVGYKDNPAFTAPDAGDVEGAKKLLTEAGVPMPYPLKVTYSGGTPTSDNSFAALKDTWDKAGFNVTLDPLTDTYYDVVQNPSNKTSDVVWGGWGADWPAISTVIPPLFDSRINLTAKSNGQDYGNYKSDAINKMLDEAAALGDLQQQADAYGKIDEALGKDVAYIPLDITKFYLLRGSKVTGYINNPATNMYADLGSVGVAK
ncbi:MAG: ABC transporter substrate-binding protein [Kineosporiaceae bacterium]